MMENKEIAVFEYNGSPISFDKVENGYMVNASQMAKPFGKRPVDYLRLPSTNELIEAKVRKSHIDANQLVKTIRGGFNPGTWLHEDIALDFAQWLSPDFRLWTLEHLKELLLTGSTTIDGPDKTKREFPRAFYREDIGTLHADYFNEKEIFFFSEDLLDILHVESALMRKCLVNKFGSGSYVRMVSESGKVYLDERGTFALLMDEDPHRGYQIIFWLLTEVIPVLDGKPVAQERQLVVGKEKISYLKSLVSLMGDVCKIADPALRCAMAEKIMALNHPDTSIN